MSSVLLSPRGTPIVAVKLLCHVRAGVEVIDGKLEWSGKYEPIEDSWLPDNRAVFIDADGNEWSLTQLDLSGVTVNLTI